MKLKQTPGDFRVEELTDRRPSHGEFALYRLTKIGWTTPDALNLLTRHWKIPFRALGYGGLKDRHAETTQLLTIFRGPRRNFHQERLAFDYLGQTNEPYSSRDIRANQFAINLRDLKASEIHTLTSAIREVEKVGVPNYFDDQRFGSVGHDGKFLAREWVFGRYEEGLKMALAGQYEFDNAETKREKAILIEHWNDWPTCKAKLPRGHARSLVDYLVHHPTDYRGAVARLRLELQGIYLSAYQSELWNRVLARWIQATFAPEDLGAVQMHRGSLPAPRAGESDRWFELQLPLACPRLKPDTSADWYPHLEAVLAEEELTLKKLKLPGLNQPFFSKGERLACLRPQALESIESEDELNPGKRKLSLAFRLPRGAYATMVVKRITGHISD